MKLWNGYGSEHSMNLVMIGHFDSPLKADKALKVLELMTERVRAEPGKYRADAGPEDRRFSDEMLALMQETGIYSIGSTELEQFEYEMRARVVGQDVVITTEESEVSAFLKVLIDNGARVEVYSAHEHPDTGYGRGH
jgi:hypothetical protein